MDSKTTNTMKYKRILHWYCLVVCLLLAPFGRFSVWVTIISFLHLIPMIILQFDKKFRL